MRRRFGDLPRPARYAIVGVACLALLLVAAATALWVVQRTSDAVLEGTTVMGEDVGGLERDELQRRVAQLADEHSEQPVVVRARDNEVTTTRGSAGSRLDVEATVEAAWGRGRGGWLDAISDHVAAWRGERQEVARPRIDGDELLEWAQETAEGLSTEPRPPGIAFVIRERRNDIGLDVSEGRDGIVVEARPLAERLRGELLEPGPVEVDADVEEVPSEIDDAEVEEARDQARRAVSARVILTNPTRGEDLELSPEDLASLLRVRPDEEAAAGERLRLDLLPEDLEDHLGDGIDELEVDATEASFEIDGGNVRIRGGRPGFEVDVEAAAERIVKLAAERRPRKGRLPGNRKAPDFSRGDAKDLGIEEKVSSFTTEFSCCQPRVKNIQRFAEIVDGALIHPAERFELNEHVGPRTRDKGFVPAPAIIGGEFEDVVGGGVSQFATTFFNAAFFAGIELDDFQPHSYYFERYPMGHEATISWGSIDLAVVNDSPHGIFVRTLTDDTSVTVEFWSTDWADVSVDVHGPTRIRKGDRRNGFDVTVHRTIEYPDGTTETEEYFHRYQPQD